MRAMIVSCVCAAGAAVWAVTGTGPDAEAIVRKPPEAVYSAVAAAFENIEQSAMLPADDNGNDVAFQVTAERESGKRIELTALLGGEQAGTLEFTFSPAEEGAATKMTGEIDVEQAVLRKHFGDGPNGDIGKIPAFAFDLAMKQALAEMADKIENGIPLQGPGLSVAETRSSQRMQDSPSQRDRQLAQK